MLKFKFGRDINGNTIIKVKKAGFRGFSVQTLGNLPQTHAMRNGEMNAHIIHDELKAFCGLFGTQHQRNILL